MVETIQWTDAGVVMLRELMFQEMEKVQRGDDPLGVVRDPNHAIIDTNLDHERGRESARLESVRKELQAAADGRQKELAKLEIARAEAKKIEEQRRAEEARLAWDRVFQHAGC